MQIFQDLKVCQREDFKFWGDFTKKVNKIYIINIWKICEEIKYTYTKEEK